MQQRNGMSTVLPLTDLIWDEDFLLCSGVGGTCQMIMLFPSGHSQWCIGKDFNASQFVPVPCLSSFAVFF